MCVVKTTVGLRIDVDTMRGTRLGIPALLHLLDQHQLKATFFFSVGPDNMGRHLWRLMRPAFLFKMLRSNAVSLYGWDVLLRGTMWPGSLIGKHCDDIIQEAMSCGHEIGLHAWDHHRWQTKVASMSVQHIILPELQKAKDMLEEITDKPVTSSAAPGWRCTDTALLEKEKLNFSYNSDCRGHSIFYPMIAGVQLSQPQIPVTLPTYDEVIGSNGINNSNYNDFLLSQIKNNQLNVLAIHAEAEGICCIDLFKDFLTKARSRAIHFTPLKKLLSDDDAHQPASMVSENIEGREGWVSRQKNLYEQKDEQ